MKSFLRGLVLCTAIASSAIGCQWILDNDKPVCPAGHPNCGCTDEKRAQGCPTTPTNMDNPLLFGKGKDGGVDGAGDGSSDVK
jgi:hypothetical protein